MSRKTIEQARLKAAVAQQTQQHTLEFYMLAFSKEPDKQGDRIARDAADVWLKNFYAAGIPLPISFTHSAVADPGNPFNIIGYAPADKAHVFKDDHGIRVIAGLDTDTNPTAAQVYALTRRGIVTGASVFFYMGPESQKIQKDGSTLITRIDDIVECGPCLDPANEDAYIIAVKAMQQAMKAVDNSTWDGNRAMGACSSAADYRSICAGEKSEGEPDQRQHWALPHHYLGRGPNAGGVRNALSRLPQTQGLKNEGAARSHLETHMREINPEAKAFITDVKVLSVEPLEPRTPSVELAIAKAGRVISEANRARMLATREGLMASLAEIDELLALTDVPASEQKADTVNEEEPEKANSEEPGPNDWMRNELAEADEFLSAS